MQPEHLTPKGEQRNVIKIDTLIAQDKTEYTIEYEMSDLAFQQFQGFNETLYSVPVTQMALLAKELDKPLPWFSRVGASVLGIKTKHQFLMFQTSRFLITVDFYEGSRIRVRVGDLMKVLETQTEKKRKNSQIVKTSEGLQWKKNFKQGQLFVNDVIFCVRDQQLQRAHSKILYSGTHYSRKIWNDICQIVEKRK